MDLRRALRGLTIVAVVQPAATALARWWLHLSVSAGVVVLGLLALEPS